MKTIRNTSWRWLLPLLMLAWLPMTVSAQTVKKPFLCIEMTDGSVQRMEIGEKYPLIMGSTEEDSATGDVIRKAYIVYDDDWENNHLEILYSDIKRFYTEFVVVDDITGLKMDTEEATTVYSPSGMLIGTEERLSEMPKGVYLMKKGKQTNKYVKK